MSTRLRHVWTRTRHEHGRARNCDKCSTHHATWLCEGSRLRSLAQNSRGRNRRVCAVLLLVPSLHEVATRNAQQRSETRNPSHRPDLPASRPSVCGESRGGSVASLKRLILPPVPAVMLSLVPTGWKISVRFVPRRPCSSPLSFSSLLQVRVDVRAARCALHAARRTWCRGRG